MLLPTIALIAGALIGYGYAFATLREPRAVVAETSDKDPRKPSAENESIPRSVKE